MVLKDNEFVALEVKRRADDHKAAEEAKRKLEETRKLEEQKSEEPEKQDEVLTEVDPVAKTESKPAPKIGLGKVSLTRPTDDQIIDVLAMHYRVHESKVIEWLLDMDLTAASDKLASNF